MRITAVLAMLLSTIVVGPPVAFGDEIWIEPSAEPFDPTISGPLASKIRKDRQRSFSFSRMYVLFTGQTKEAPGKCTTRFDQVPIPRYYQERDSFRITLPFNVVKPDPPSCETNFALFSHSYGVVTFSAAPGNLSDGHDEIKSPAHLRGKFLLRLHAWLLDCRLAHGEECKGEVPKHRNAAFYDANSDIAHAAWAFSDSASDIQIDPRSRTEIQDISFKMSKRLREGQRDEVSCEGLKRQLKKEFIGPGLNVYYHRLSNLQAKGLYCRPEERNSDSPQDKRDSLEKYGFILIKIGAPEETLTHEIGHFLRGDPPGKKSGHETIFGNYMSQYASNSVFRCDFNVEQFLVMKPRVDELRIERWRNFGTSEAEIAAWTGETIAIPEAWIGADRQIDVVDSLRATMGVRGSAGACPQIHASVAMAWITCENEDFCSTDMPLLGDVSSWEVLQKVGNVVSGSLRVSEIDKIARRADRDWEKLKSRLSEFVTYDLEAIDTMKKAFVKGRKEQIHINYRMRAADLLGNCALQANPKAWESACRTLDYLTESVARSNVAELLDDYVVGRLNMAIKNHKYPTDECHTTSPTEEEMQCAEQLPKSVESPEEIP